MQYLNILSVLQVINMKINKYEEKGYIFHLFKLLKCVLMQIYLQLNRSPVIRWSFLVSQTNIYWYISVASARNVILEHWFKFSKMSKSSRSHIIFCGPYFRWWTKISQNRFMQYRRSCIMTRTFNCLLSCHLATVNDAFIYILLGIFWIASPMVKLFIYLPSGYEKW